MSDEKELMANITPFGLRMQPDLKARIAQAAKDNNRSMNAEIIDRLERSESLFLRQTREWVSMLRGTEGSSERTHLSPSQLSGELRDETLREQIEKLSRQMAEVATRQKTLIHLLERQQD